MIMVPIEVLRSIKKVDTDTLLSIYSECSKEIKTASVGSFDYCLYEGLMNDTSRELKRRGVKYE